MDALKPAMSPTPERRCTTGAASPAGDAATRLASLLTSPTDAVDLGGQATDAGAQAVSQPSSPAGAPEVRLRDILKGAVKTHLIGVPALVAAALEACTQASDAVASKDFARQCVQEALSAVHAVNADTVANVLAQVDMATEIEDSRLFARGFLMPTDNPPELAARAQQIVDRLESADPSDLHVRALVMDDSGFMAFAKGGENLFLSAGTLTLAEGEVAAVLAHERAHLLARHLPQVSICGYVAQELAARAVGNPSVAAAVSLICGLDKAAMQREQEFTADAAGARMIAAAGYDAANMGRALSRTITEKKREPGPLDDHPPLATRLEALEKGNTAGN